MLSTVPDVVFKTRVRDESIGGDNPFRWQDVSTDDIFKGKKIVVFNNCLFLNILDIGKFKYLIVDDTNWYGGQLSVYKLNHESIDLVKRDGFSKD